MKQLFEGEVLDVLSVAGGIVFAYVSDRTADGQTMVAYRLVNFETGRGDSVGNTIYQLAKFGPDYSKMARFINHHLTTSVAMLGNGRVLLSERDGTAKLIKDGEEIEWVGKFLYKNEAPCSLCGDGDTVWGVFKNSGVAVRFSAKTLRSELRIGGSGGEFSFDKPCNIYQSGEELFISNCGNNKIWKLNTKTYRTEEYMSFEEPVMYYTRSCGYELAVLSSGIYIL
ncbi:MAG: hypothetical protein KBS41_01500 [Oscillospiraceae bacterium]|nr:hypothetical protein [Candidatus Equicaccousia limihippi]